MILKNFMLVLCITLSLSYFGQVTRLSNALVTKQRSHVQDSVLQKAEELKSIYPQLSSSYQGIYDHIYFEAFPKSFKMLNALFGYTNKEPMGTEFDPGPLYDEAHMYVKSFFELNIEKKRHYKRMIEIALNGRWYADGVNYFSRNLQEKVKQDLEIFCELLINYTDEEIQSFWYFYFDGPHPVRTIPLELEKTKQTNKRVYCFMEAALKEVQLFWKE